MHDYINDHFVLVGAILSLSDEDQAKLSPECQQLLPPQLRVMNRALKNLMPLTKDVRDLNETFKAMRPAAEARDVLSDASIYAQMVFRVTGNGVSGVRKTTMTTCNNCDHVTTTVNSSGCSDGLFCCIECNVPDPFVGIPSLQDLIDRAVAVSDVDEYVCNHKVQPYHTRRTFPLTS